VSLRGSPPASFRRVLGSGFAWLVGSILVSYEALAEAAKYGVPSVASWIAVEVAAGFVQFTFYGVLLGLVHRGRDPLTAP